MQQAARRLLRAAGPSVFKVELALAARHFGLARDGKAALRLAIQEKPDMMTLDLTMPEMDGIACLEEVMKAVPSISVLVVSALDDKPTAIKALKLGARGFIRKPFTDEQLVKAFLQLIEQP